MIACLGGVLENTIYRGEEGTPLSKELELMRSYIQIKSQTLKHRRGLKIEVPEQFYQYPVFEYCLQPVVGSAMICGMEEAQNGTITIQARQETDCLFLNVRNSGTEVMPEQIKSILGHVWNSIDSRRTLIGMGLSSIDGMMELRYGKKHGISMVSAPGQETTVFTCLSYPVTRKGEDTDEGASESSDC